MLTSYPSTCYPKRPKEIRLGLALKQLEVAYSFLPQKLTLFLFDFFEYYLAQGYFNLN
jgi:hypothetical protein